MNDDDDVINLIKKGDLEGLKSEYISKDGWYLLIAAERGYIDIVDYLIRSRGMNPHREYNFMRTILHHAVINGHLNLVKYLIREFKMNPNNEDVSKCNALHHASTGGYLDIVMFLVDVHGMDPRLKDGDGYNAIRKAYAHDNSSNLDILFYFTKKGYFTDYLSLRNPVKKFLPHSRDKEFNPRLVLNSLGLINIILP